MRAAEDRDVPLSRQPLELLRLMAADRSSDLIFESDRVAGVMDLTAILKLSKRLAPGVTVHGMRSAFRDWAGVNGIERELSERSLAHAFGNAVEAAYARSTLLEPQAAGLEMWRKQVAEFAALPEYPCVLSDEVCTTTL